jgi:tetratricopeptide (TPR) repeat protein
MGSFWSSPDKADHHFNYAKALMQDGDTDAALAELERVIAVDPEHTAAYTAIGDIHRKRGDYELAEQNYKRACETDPYAFRPHYNLGVTYQTMAEISRNIDQVRNYLREAVVTYIRAIAIKPESFDANLNLGACYYQLGQYALAEQATRDALVIQPGSSKANNNLGIIHENLGQYAEAVQAYKASIEANPHQPSILLNLGAIYMRSGHFHSAMSTFRSAARLAPDSAAPWIQIGVCQFRMKNLDDAVKSFQKAIQLEPQNPRAYRGFGVICMYEYVVNHTRTDLRDRALQAWKYSLRLDPGQEDLRQLIQRYGSTRPAPPSTATPSSGEKSQAHANSGHLS